MMHVRTWRTAIIDKHGPGLTITVPANINFIQAIVFVAIAGPMLYGYVRLCLYPDVLAIRSWQDFSRWILLALAIGLPLTLALQHFAEQIFGFQELCLSGRHLVRKRKALFWTRSKRLEIAEIAHIEAVSGTVLAIVYGRTKKLLEGLSIESATATAAEVRRAISRSGR
jgi:hypothetical protein